MRTVGCCAVSVAHLLIGAEGLLALQAYGVDPEVALSVINVSSGRSLQTARRIPGTVPGVREVVDPSKMSYLHFKDPKVTPGWFAGRLSNEGRKAYPQTTLQIRKIAMSTLLLTHPVPILKRN